MRRYTEEVASPSQHCTPYWIVLSGFLLLFNLITVFYMSIMCCVYSASDSGVNLGLIPTYAEN